MSLARPFLTSVLAYVNYLSSRSPPPPPKQGSKLKDTRKDIRFVKIAAMAVRISQMALVLASLSELLVILGVYNTALSLDTILSLLVMDPQQRVTVASKIRLTPLAYIGWIIGASGSLLRYWSINSLGGLFTFQLTVTDKHRLITTGPYSYVRHPGYSGSIISAVGTSIYFLGSGSYVYECSAWRTFPGLILVSVWISWKLFMSVNVLRRVEQEDKFLEEEFDREWTLWKKQVRFRLFPGIY